MSMRPVADAAVPRMVVRHGAGPVPPDSDRPDPAGGGRIPADPSWDRFADTLYVIAQQVGRPVDERLAGLGLAGALLVELAWHGRIQVVPAAGGSLHGALVGVTGGRDWPADLLAATVLQDIAGDPVVGTVRDWLLVFAEDAADRVARRMADQGRVTMVTHRSLWRGTRTVVTPVSAQAADELCLELGYRFRTGVGLAGEHLVLAGLGRAVGIDSRYLGDLIPEKVTALYRRVDELPAPIRLLLDELAEAVTTALTTRRR